MYNQRSVVVPPSKSISHRALICASLARGGESNVNNPLSSEDTLCTRRCLEALGARFLDTQGGVKVRGIPYHMRYPSVVEMDVGESGTTCRLITPVVAALEGVCARIYGRGRMHKRPVDELAMALEGMGSQFTWEGRPGYPPYVVCSKEGLAGRKIGISLEKSSQFLSGLLLASPLAKGVVEIEITGEKVVSWPYVGLTLEVMEAFGVEVKVFTPQGGEWKRACWREVRDIIPGEVLFRVEPTLYLPCDFFVEGDWSNASYFVAAGLFLREGLTIKGLKRNSLQGDRAIVDILKGMGGEIHWVEEDLVISPSRLRGIEVNMAHCPDLVPTVAVVASLAEGDTTIRGVAHLTIKESNRLLAVAREVEKTGAHVRIFEDGLIISPAPPIKGRVFNFSTYSDHRMAMSLSIYEIAGARVTLDDIGCVAKSFPDFFKVWDSIRC